MVLRSLPMSLAVVVLLAVLWAWMLLPGALRERRERSPFASISRFERSMGILADRSRRPVPGIRPGPPGRRILVLTDPHSLVGASSRARIVRRRQVALLRLCALGGATGALAVALRGWAIWPAVASVAILAGYAAELARLRANQREARRKTRRLPVRPPARAPARDQAERHTAVLGPTADAR
ncbi:hypothetical protein BH20ACT8_BH20ACT8_19160 [soil metagenome]